ncbi:GNAT family N-acetyltransferase [Deinococcus radiomollis]|uniref:GNAT family N-acetyltransferase n=1 Tax=Deinococcus radiomollis TaxID=468916 RepID=UPI00389247E4
MTCTVRLATRADVPDILDIYNEAVLNTTASYDLEPVSLESRLEWFGEKQRSGHPVFVAERMAGEGGEVLGWSTYGAFRAKPGYAYTAEHSVYVAAGARAQGVGHALMLPVIEHARAAGLHVLVGGVDASNAASLGLHLSLGFEQVAHFRQVGRKFGRWLDLAFLQLLL